LNAKKVVAAAGVGILFIAGIAQFATGMQSLFGPPALPECDSGDASDLVSQIIKDNYQVELEQLDEVAQVDFDETAQSRRCTASINVATEGAYDIAYRLSWQNRDDRMLAAELEVLGQTTQ
jgi:hypothetical protein